MLMAYRKELKALWKLVVDNYNFEHANSPVLIEQFSNLQTDDEDNSFTLRTIPIERMCQVWAQLQGEPIAQNDMLAMIDRVASSKVNPEKKLISYSMFISVFTSKSTNDVFDAKREGLYQDMNHPLSHYFIASSHNTYLEGDQLMSNSSVQRYIDDVTSGCRCVELDCWDGDKGQPIIYHGHTLTSKILFVGEYLLCVCPRVCLCVCVLILNFACSLTDVIKALKQHAFKTSPYPVILSIENHCCLQQQQTLATIMKTEFGDMLGWPSPNNGKPGAVLPSPEMLRNKILVKGKRLGAPDVDDDEEEEDEKEDEGTGTGASAATAATSPTEQTQSPQPNSKRMSSKSGDAVGDEKGEGKDKAKSEKKHSTHPDLSDITYLGPVKVHDFDEAGNPQIPCDSMCSFSEGKTFKTLKNADTVQGWIKHNEKHLRYVVLVLVCVYIFVCLCVCVCVCGSF
jgi:LysM repeat protein